MEGTSIEITEAKRQKENKVVIPLAETNASITKTEANEFLKFIKHNEYNVINQLNKTPTRIFLVTIDKL